MRYLRYFCRFITGSVFIFSGFVKAIDPLGSAYKFSDYFTAFKLGFLKELSLPLAIVISSFELTLGMAIILGYRKKTVYWMLMVFMSFFTILTLILALFNPVSDCGCFGDALILTNWQTFLKNILLMLFVVLLFEDRNRKYLHHGALFEWGIIGVLFAAATFFSGWNLRHLPVIDFRPYDVGTVISDEMSIPENAPVDKYETTLYYRNRQTGLTEEFSIRDYPKDTANWEFIDSESRLILKGYEPPIHDFAILDPYNEDVTDDLIHYTGYSLLMISYDIEKAAASGLEKSAEWEGLQRIAGDFRFYPITASPQEKINAIKRENALDYDFYAADETMLKTVIRSNPGFVLLKNGTITGKWNWRDFPQIKEIDAQWPEMILSASFSDAEGQEIPMDGGTLAKISYDMVRFDQHALKLLFAGAELKGTRAIWFGFAVTILMIISFLQVVVRVKKEIEHLG